MSMLGTITECNHGHVFSVEMLTLLHKILLVSATKCFTYKCYLIVTFSAYCSIKYYMSPSCLIINFRTATNFKLHKSSDDKKTYQTFSELIYFCVIL